MAGIALERNVGPTDRYLRITVGGLLLAAAAGRMAREGFMGGLGTGLLGGTMLAEGVLGTCPLYTLLGVDTRTENTSDLISPYEGF